MLDLRVFKYMSYCLPPTQTPKVPCYDTVWVHLSRQQSVNPRFMSKQQLEQGRQEILSGCWTKSKTHCEGQPTELRVFRAALSESVSDSSQLAINTVVVLIQFWRKCTWTIRIRLPIRLSVLSWECKRMRLVELFLPLCPSKKQTDKQTKKKTKKRMKWRH